MDTLPIGTRPLKPTSLTSLPRAGSGQPAVEVTQEYSLSRQQVLLSNLHGHHHDGLTPEMRIISGVREPGREPGPQ